MYTMQILVAGGEEYNDDNTVNRYYLTDTIILDEPYHYNIVPVTSLLTVTQVMYL